MDSRRASLKFITLHIEGVNYCESLSILWGRSSAGEGLICAFARALRRCSRGEKVSAAEIGEDFGAGSLPFFAA